MKKILFALLLLPVFASAQRLQYVNNYGYQYQRLVIDSLFAPPSDTFTVPTALQGYPFIARKGTGLYLWNTSTHVWAAVSGSGGGTYYNSNVGSGYRWAIPNTNNIKTFTATNGLSADSATGNQIGVQLGGTLTSNTTVSGNTSFALSFPLVAQFRVQQASSAGYNFQMTSSKILLNSPNGTYGLTLDNTAGISVTGIPNTASSKVLHYDPSTGLVSYADTTTMVYPGAGIPNSTGSAWGTSYSTTGSGTVVALATQPTFTTDITTPMIVGGSATGQKITLKTTTGVGSGDSILFKGGNNGATTFASIQSSGLNLLDNSYLKMGGSNILHFNTGSNNATFAGAYNFLFNNGGNVFMNTANTTYFSTSTGDLYFSGSGKLGIGTATPDSSLTVTAGIWGKRGVRFTGLPSSHNADDSMLVVNASNGTVGYRPVTPSLTSTQIAFGDGSNLMTGSSDLIADASGGAGFMQIGINTTPGGQALSVKGQTVLGLTNTYNISGMLGTNNNVAYMGDAEQNGSGNVIQVKDGDGISYYDNTSHTGKFGVNTSTPGGPLHVKANAGAIDALFVDGTTGNVGIGTATPNSTLHNNGSFAGNYIATATGITLDATNYVVAVTATGQTVTLPDAVGIDGRIYTIKLTAFGSCTVSTTGGETIDASGTYSLASQYKYVTIMSNGANWIVIGNN